MQLMGNSQVFRFPYSPSIDIGRPQTEQRGPSHAPGTGEHSVCSVRSCFSYVQTGADDIEVTVVERV